MQAIHAPAVQTLTFDEPELEGSVPQRLARVAARLPDQPAIRAGEQTYTFRDLNELTGHIAGGLAAVVTAPEARIPLLFAPGAAMAVLAIHGVLRAGGCYTGLNPADPLERNRALLDDCEPAALLTDRQHAGQGMEIAKGQRPVLVIEELLDAPAQVSPRQKIGLDQLAALLYTSGSTGRPKGIEFTQRQLLGRARHSVRERGLGPADRLVLPYQIAFAGANTAVFAGPLAGATIYPMDLRQLSGPELLAFLRREAITVFSMPIALFRQTVSQLDGLLDLPHLRLLILGGTTLLPADVEAFRRHLPPSCALENCLATTETGTVTRFVSDHQSTITTPRVPVGRPVEGVEVRLWDEAGRPALDGQTGEIVVRSAYLARGYWRNPELTRQVFLPDPDGGARGLYRTGDMGRWLPDGDLVHLGRKDQMVKIAATG